MDAKRGGAPLYLHITLLAVGLVAATGSVMLWFGDLVPGIWEFVVLLTVAALVAQL